MPTLSQLRAPGHASAMHRNSHRGLITDNTNSFARVVQSARCKPCAHSRLRAPTTTPRPAAAAAGKINSSTTHLRNLVVVSASRPVSGRFGFARHIGVGSPIHFPRRLRGASTLRSVLYPHLCCEQRRAGSSARLRLGSGVVVGVGGGRTQNPNTNFSMLEIREPKRAHVGRSTVESTRAAKSCPGRGPVVQASGRGCHD
jgi:hypothetical protein